MPKYFKYTLFGVGGLVALFALLLAVVAFTVDPNSFKPQIVKLVQEKKQRTLTIEGDIKLKLFPKLGVDLGKTFLSEHKGSAEFAALDSVRLYVAWLPLLKKSLVVDKVTLEGVRANLIRYADGSTNFDDLMSKDESEQFKFDIDGVRVSKSALTFDDRMAKRKLAVSEIEMESGRLKDQTATDIKLALKLVADKPKVAVKISLNMGLWFALDEKHFVAKKLTLTVQGEAVGVNNLELSAKGDVDIKARTQEIALQGFRLTAQGRQAANKLDIVLDVPKLLLTQVKAAATQVTLNAKIDQPSGQLRALLSLPDLSGNSKQFQISGMSLEIEGKQGDHTIKGKLVSPVTGSLDARRFDLTKLNAQFDVTNPGFPKGGGKTTVEWRCPCGLEASAGGGESAYKI